MSEVNQATGARTYLWMFNETGGWGDQPVTPVWRALRMIGGTKLNRGIQTYASREIKSNRMRNKSVRGTQRPDGTLPFELSPSGWNTLWWHLLGGAAPAATVIGGGINEFVIKGSPLLGVTGSPLGFTIEEGFQDVDTGAKGIFVYRGCRVNKLTLSSGVDQVVSGSWDIYMKQADSIALTSINTGAAPTLSNLDPYTSVQVAVKEGAGLATLGIAEQMTLEVDNQYRADKGFVLGSNVRQNLKAGTRMTSVTGTFFFKDHTLLEEAINGTATKLQLLVSNAAGHKCQIDLPNGQFLPADDPVVSDDGPLTIDARFEAVEDATEASDIKVTIRTPDASLST